MNNTSIPFFLPSEFKSKWENLVKNILLECFESYWSDPIVLSIIVRSLFKYIYGYTNEILKKQLEKVATLFGDTLVEEKHYERYLDNFRSIIQEKFSYCFEFISSYPKIKASIIDKKGVIDISNYLADKQNILNTFFHEMTNDIYKEALEQMFYISIYMLLHEPPLTFESNSSELKYMFFNKDRLVSIEGFNKNEPSLVILNPPLVSRKHIYQGMKPVVYVLTQYNQEILEECHRNETDSSEISNKKTLITLEEDEIRSITQLSAIKESNRPNFKRDPISPDQKTIEDINRKGQASRNNNLLSERESEGLKNCYEHPLYKGKVEVKSSSSLGENNHLIYNSKETVNDRGPCEEGTVLNTETLLLSCNNPVINTEPCTKSFSQEKRSPFSQTKINHKNKLSEFDNSIKDTDELSKKLKNPLMNSKSKDYINNEGSYLVNSNKRNNGENQQKRKAANKLEFKNTGDKDLVIPNVRFPESKLAAEASHFSLQEIISRIPKNVGKVQSINTPTGRRKEQISHRLPIPPKTTDSIESIRVSINANNNQSGSNNTEKAIINPTMLNSKQSKKMDKPNRLYTYLMYNEKIKFEPGLGQAKKKTMLTSRGGNAKLTGLSKEKLLKI